MSRSVLRWSLFALLLALSCCGYESAPTTDPSPDYELFASSVYPVLLRDCAFSGCHGNEARFFRVYGPGRLRISDQLEYYDPATPAEIHHSYERARSMLRGVHGIDDSLLLRKPLDAREGGAGRGHQGADQWGHDVYRNASDVAYQKIAAWAHASSSDFEARAASAREQSGEPTP